MAADDVCQCGRAGRTGVLILPLVPAALINLAAVHTQGSVMAAVAIAFVATGALAVEGVFDGKDLMWRLACACLALFFVSANIYTALSNVAGTSEQSRGMRDKKMRDHDRDKSGLTSFPRPARRNLPSLEI